MLKVLNIILRCYNTGVYYYIFQQVGKLMANATVS